jgi:hypothetical protein
MKRMIPRTNLDSLLFTHPFPEEGRKQTAQIPQDYPQILPGATKSALQSMNLLHAKILGPSRTTSQATTCVSESFSRETNSPNPWKRAPRIMSPIFPSSPISSTSSISPCENTCPKSPPSKFVEHI